MPSKEELSLIVNNEQEWRRYMITRLDKLDQDFNIFKLKSLGFLTVISGVINLVLRNFDK